MRRPCLFAGWGAVVLMDDLPMYSSLPPLGSDKYWADHMRFGRSRTPPYAASDLECARLPPVRVVA